MGGKEPPATALLSGTPTVPELLKTFELRQHGFATRRRRTTIRLRLGARPETLGEA